MVGWDKLTGERDVTTPGLSPQGDRPLSRLAVAETACRYSVKATEIQLGLRLRSCTGGLVAIKSIEPQTDYL